MNPLFPKPNGASENQPALKLDDGSGLRVVKAKFVDEQQFDWDLFDGYD